MALNGATLRMAAGVLALLASLALFLLSCYSAASDAQGAILFLFTLPLCALLCAAAWIVNRATKTRPAASNAVVWGARGGLTVLALFLASAFVAPLQFVPNALIGGVAAAFEAVTGLSPYAWERREALKRAPQEQQQ
jgi:hypothetical protein